MENKNKFLEKFNKKTIFKILGVIAWIFLVVGIAYATFEKNRRVDKHTYYKIKNKQTLNIDRGSKCRKVYNKWWVSYFIPIKTNTEWYSFVNHKPSWVTIYNECYISKWYDKWSSFWMRWPGTKFTVCYHWYCVEWETAWESASIYRYWKTDWSAYTHRVPWRKVKRWKFHHSSWWSNYYYVTIKE